MTVGLMALALLVQPPSQPKPQPRPYRWRDPAGQVHITTTPPPPDAEVLEAPQAPGVEMEQTLRPQIIRQSASTNKDGHRQVTLNPAQKEAWAALDQKLAEARAQGNRRILEAVTNSLIHDCLWGNGLWFMPVVPILSVLLMGLLGWWLALGLRTGPKIPLISGFLLLGLGFGHLLLNLFLYHPQATRLRQNLELLEHHLGTGKDLRPEYRALLQKRYLAMEQAADDPLQAPWRFPNEVKALHAAMTQVMVEP